MKIEDVKKEEGDTGDMGSGPPCHEGVCDLGPVTWATKSESPHLSS